MLKLQLSQYAQLNLSHKEQCRELWNREYPAEILHPDIDSFDQYLDNLSDTYHILILDDLKQLKGWYFDFVRENERWFALILDKEIQNQGFGSQMIENAKKKHSCLNAWVIDRSDYKKASGETYRSPLPFYQKMGFQVMENKRLSGAKISAVKILWYDENQV